MSLPRRRDLLLALALVGVGIAAYLTYIGFNEQVKVVCTLGGNCETVQQSRYAKIVGIPVATFGLAMYLGIVALLVARRIERWRDVPLLAAWTFALALGGVVYSAYLTYLELVVIHAICTWCVASAIVVTLICLLSAPDVRRAAPVGRG